MSTEPEALPLRDLLAAISGSVTSALPVFVLAALSVQVQDSLHFGAAEFGVVISLYYLSAAVTSIPLSHAVEVIGSLRFMRLACATLGIVLAAMGGTAQSLLWLASLMAIAGMISAGIQPATNLFLVRRIPRKHHGLAFGAKQAAVPIAVLIGGIFAPAIALIFGWRWAFVAAAILAITTSILLPRSQTSLSAYRALPPVERLPARSRWSISFLTFGFALGVASASALSAFTVSATVAAGESETVAGLLVALGGFVAAGTRIGVGLHADHTTRGRLDVVAWMLCIGAVGYILIALSSGEIPRLLVPGIVLAFSAGWGWNGLFNLAIVSSYPAQAAQTTGISSVGGRIGGVIGPAVFGAIATHHSYSSAWLLTAAAALASGMVIYLGRHILDHTQ